MYARTNLLLALTLIAALAIIALVAIGAQEIGPASAGAPLLVTKNADTNDGTCDADCSLREAIVAANANPDADTITLPADTYTFTIAGTGEDLAATGDLDITEDLTINGAGMASTTIDAAQLDRVFDVDPAEGGVITVLISGVTIQGGAPGGHGGGVRNSGNLTLNTVTIGGNETNEFNRAGGGIYNHNEGVMIVNDSTISDNHAKSGGGGSTGGGIQNAESADITVNNTTIINNSATSGGGFHNSNAATATINNGTVKDNDSLTFSGGGISVTQGTEMTINNTSIIGNLAVTEGGGVYNSGSAVVTINNSTIVGNHAVDGGGLHQDAGDEAVTTVTNSTITDNSAEEDGGGMGRVGEGVINLNNVTITGNGADSGDANGTGDGGGISNEAGGAVNLKNTIVAGNTDPTSDPDCFGILTSEGYNLIENVSAGCTIAGNTTGNVTGADPLLMPLAANGGPTDTHAIPAGSPAVDAGNPANPGSGVDACEADDQRGISRPLDGDSDSTALCDIGAYEAPGNPPTPTPVPTPTPSPTPTPTPMSTPTPTGTPPAGQSVIWGDADCDTTVGTRDSQALLRFVLQQPALSQTPPCRDIGEAITVDGNDGVWGDWDCDSTVGTRDSQAILRNVLEQPALSQTQPCPLIGDLVQVSD